MAADPQAGAEEQKATQRATGEARALGQHNTSRCWGGEREREREREKRERREREREREREEEREREREREREPVTPRRPACGSAAIAHPMRVLSLPITASMVSPSARAAKLRPCGAETGWGELNDVVDGRRQAAFEQGAGAYRKHEGLARARARTHAISVPISTASGPGRRTAPSSGSRRSRDSPTGT